jgi:hypothetical protein
MAMSDMDAAIASEYNQGRQAEGRGGTAFSAPSATPLKGTLEPRKNVQAGDPTAAGTRVARPNRLMSSAERNGAAHTIVTSIFKPNEPSAGATLANARVIPATTKRNFSGGLGSSY